MKGIEQGGSLGDAIVGEIGHLFECLLMVFFVACGAVHRNLLALAIPLGVNSTLKLNSVHWALHSHTLQYCKYKRLAFTTQHCTRALFVILITQLYYACSKFEIVSRNKRAPQ